jgi:hypothetical protein
LFSRVRGINYLQGFLAGFFRYLGAIMKVRGVLMLLFAGICLIGLAPASAGDKDKKAGDKDKKANFYPLQVGNTWHFKAEVMGKTNKTVYKVTRIEKVDGVDLAVLEVTVEGKVVATEHVQQTDKGVFRHKFNAAAIEPPFRMLPYPIKADEKWEGEIKSGGTAGNYTARTKEEEIEVPAGKFKTIRVDFDLVEKGNKVSTSYWFAADTGFVKQTVDAGPLHVVISLEKFEAGKK